ncbi:MAG TPA: hypothetical protein ACFYD7_12985 [Candidatus Wujingus californicus]
MRHCLVLVDKVAKLPFIVKKLIINQGVTHFPLRIKRDKIFQKEIEVLDY